MLEQPWSVVEGSAMAATGSMLLSWNRARYAAVLMPLMYGEPAQQRAAADAWERLSTALSEHPDLVEASVKDVRWTAPSADLYQGTVRDYSGDAADKAASPKASADMLRVTADVYDILGKAVFLTGAGILTAGVLYRVAQANPFTRAAVEVAATGFGRRADQQAGTIAARLKAYMTGGKGLLGKAVQKLAQMPAGTKGVAGGLAVAAGGMTAQSAVASQYSGTKLESPTGQPMGRPVGQEA
jgi:hypothetical protein